MSSIWKVGVILLLVVALLPMLNVAWADHSRSEFTVEGEILFVDYDEPVPVNESAHHYNDSVALSDEGAGTKLVDGTDYEWNATNGSVAFINTTTTDDTEIVRIDYKYYERAQSTRLAGNVVTPWGRVLALMAVFVLVLGGYGFAVGGGRGL